MMKGHNMSAYEDFDPLDVKPTDGPMMFMLAEIVISLRSISYDMKLIAEKLGAVED